MLDRIVSFIIHGTCWTNETEPLISILLSGSLIKIMSPRRAPSKEDLPEPTSPMTQMNSPFLISMFMSRSVM